MNTKYTECDCCMKGYFKPNEFGLCHCSCSECCKPMSICLYNCKYYKKIIKKQLKKIYTIVMSELLQYGKTTIKIPEKMMLLKNGKETLQDVITKTGNLTTRNKEKSLRFETTKSNTISIKTVPVEIKPVVEIKKKEEPKENDEDKKVREYEKEKSITRRIIDEHLRVKDYIGLLNNKTINFNDKKNMLRNLSFKELKELTFDKLSEFVKFKNIKVGDICSVYLNNKKALGYCVKKTAKTLTFEKIELLEHDFIKMDEFNYEGRKDFGQNEYYYYIDKPSVDSSEYHVVRFKTEEEGLNVYNNPCVIRLIGNTHNTF